MTVKDLKEFLANVPDDAEVCVVRYSYHLLSVKHASLVTYTDGSGDFKVGLCPMGAHWPSKGKEANWYEFHDPAKLSDPTSEPR